MAKLVKPATRTVKLYVGGDLDLVDEYNRLEAEQANPTSLAGTEKARLEEIRQQILADTMEFKFRGLGHRPLQKILDEHPPRQGRNRDQVLGFNEDTATDALIRKCLVEPDLPDAALTELLDEDLSDGQYEQLSQTVWALNRRAVDVPFLLNGSSKAPSSAAG